ncbi:triose-phosphate isomerase [Methanospirillum stamsii]|uniref:Triosephosphate isomerase n=1 Tax=Methanospirillum stamsii TaxID=1277351 RepID=A0A2V2MWS2_9EURY|nr:triose-phosphate isomerase [Methanospirillum stamsii]PWR71839.1 triose-phosphate isomerase [Methanospirillum stamsii]
MKPNSLNTPLVLVNLKCYTESIGNGAHRIARAAREVTDESGVTIGLAPLYPDIHPINHHYDIPVFAQHVDPVEPGAHTGRMPLLAVKSAGAIGSLVNHSEYRLNIADIEKNVTALRDAGMLSCVCSNNIATTAALSALGPDYVAIEPPELIGGKISVSEANPGIITGSVDIVKKINPAVKVLTGAGIHSGKCVKTAIDLGTDGVLLASSVVKAEDPAAVLRDLVSLL